MAVGPLVGGVLTDAFGWEWIFLVNVPIGLVTLALTLMRVRESERDPTARIDWAGLVTFSAGLSCLVFALIRGNDDGWGSTKIIGLLVVGTLLLVAFAAVELRSDQPMLDLHLFRIPTFTGAQIVAFRSTPRCSDVPLHHPVHPERPRLARWRAGSASCRCRSSPSSPLQSPGELWSAIRCAGS